MENLHLRHPCTQLFVEIVDLGGMSEDSIFNLAEEIGEELMGVAEHYWKLKLERDKIV